MRRPRLRRHRDRHADQPISNVNTLDHALAEHRRPRLYGVIAYGVTQRRQEMGVRDALDAPVLTLAPLALIAIALAACAIPARRAMRVNPVEVLRGD